jgi:hypothetical protein
MSAREERDAFMVGREFAHLHPPQDGSLHLVLPPTEVDDVIANGWAERHPLAGRFGLPENVVMVCGPRDEDELHVVQELVSASHTFAGGFRPAAGDALANSHMSTGIHSPVPDPASSRWNDGARFRRTGRIGRST